MMYFSSVGIIYRNCVNDQPSEDYFLRCLFGEVSLAARVSRYGGFYYLPEVMARYSQAPQSIYNPGRPPKKDYGSSQVK